MEKIFDNSLQVPYKEKLSDDFGFLSFPWQNFFKTLYLYVSFLGTERSSKLKNNLATAEKVDGMQFDSGKIAHAIIDFVIHRVTVGTGATELIESGSMHVVYRPASKAWSLYKTSPTAQPNNSGITFSMSASTLGQVEYVSTNITGTEKLSKITWRARTMAAKGYQVIPELA